jgi:hypothetical protein
MKMPISFKIYEDHGLFLSSWIGTISDSDLISSYKQLLEDENFKPGLHELADARKAEMSGVTTEGFRKLSAMVESHLAGKCHSFKTAVIAPEGFTYGMSRMYEIISYQNTETVRVFREPDEAIKWLGIENIKITDLT